jgi:formamidopyrimidine-DNA glycosylase
MPELPEVETTRRGIEPHVRGQQVVAVIVRQPRLRWPIPSQLKQKFTGQIILTVERRAKYLLLGTQCGTVILHLGMSGSLRILDACTPPQAHDHVDFVLSEQRVLRLRDPRRFGALLWIEDDPMLHPLLRDLGPEPLSDGFDGDYLYERSRAHRVAVKAFIMNSHIVTGLGNIYANEALFHAGIHPHRAVNRIARNRYRQLATSIKRVLQNAIAYGGTTLRDFTREDGKPGYFRNKLQVYGRAEKPCINCGQAIVGRIQGQRATYYCPRCQH